MKFKVGDKVRVRDDLVGGVTYDGIYFGFCMEPFRGKEFIVTYIANGIYYLNDGRDYTYHESMLEPIIDEPMEKLVIYRDGGKTIAKYYKSDKVINFTIKNSQDFKVDSEFAMRKLFEKMKQEEVGYSWVKCVGYRTTNNFNFTIDKKYKIYDNGRIIDDSGFVFRNTKTKKDMLDFLSEFFIFEEVKPS